MGFTSQVLDGELIIHDTSPDELHRVPDGQSKGLDLSLRPDMDYAYGAAADPFPAELLIDPSEWQSRIQEMEQTNSRISDLITLQNLPPKDQQRTNFCWCNAPVHCLEIIRLQQNLPMIILSPASVACLINGFKNQGGWGQQALQRIADKGVDPVSLWPANAIDHQYATPENATAALDYCVDKWIELKPRTMSQLMSMLLRRIPVACGFNWWHHEVTACDPVWLDGAAAIRIRNSWGPSYGKNGFAVLQGSKALPDDACAPASAMIS